MQQKYIPLIIWGYYTVRVQIKIIKLIQRDMQQLLFVPSD